MSPDNRKLTKAGPSTSFEDVTNGSSSDNKKNKRQAPRTSEEVNYTSKIQKRKRDSSSPESNSFVSTVKTKMTNLLQASFSKWFSSPSSSKSNGSVPMIDVTDSSTDDDREPETPVVVNSPPAKRKKYSSYLKIDVNCLVQRNRGDTSVPFRNKSSRPSDEEIVERSEQRHMPLKRKLPFHCDDRPAKISPSHNSMVDLKQPSFKQSLVGSLFYPGRTSYGGAASQYINQPNITERKDTHVTEVINSNSLDISHSSRRVMDLLDQYSSPRKDALRLPQYDRTPRRNSSSVNSSVLSLNKTQELHVPSILSLLRLKQRSRLMDGTNAARQIMASQSSTINNSNYSLIPTSTQRETTRLNSSGVTQSSSARPVKDMGSITDAEFESGSPPARTLIFPPISTASVNSMSTNNNNDYKFSSPVEVSSWSPGTVSTPPIYTFGSPDSDVDLSKDKRNHGFVTPLKDAETDASKLKDWQCPDCWVINNAPKCPCCGAQKPNAVEKKAKCTVCKQSYRQSHIDKCVSCEKIPTTTSYYDLPSTTPYSRAITNPLPINRDKSKWICYDCLVGNEASTEKCVCCGAKNQDSPGNVTADLQNNEWTCGQCSIKNKISVDKCTGCGDAKLAAKQNKSASLTSSFKPPTSIVDSRIQNIVNKQNEQWECDSCMVRNDSNKIRCVCCDKEKPGAVKQIAVDSKVKTIVEKQNEKWECGSCMVRNDSNKIKCVCCETEKPGAVKQNKNTFNFGMSTTSAVDSKVKTIVEKQNEKWECGSCMVRNDSNKIKCVCCEAERSGLVKEIKNTFNFGMNTSQFKFGIDPKEQESNLKKSEPKDNDLHKESETNNNILPKMITFSLPAKVSDDQTNSSATDIKNNAAPKIAFSFGISKQIPEVKPEEKTVDNMKEKLQDLPKVNLTTQETKLVGNPLSAMFNLTPQANTEKPTALPAALPLTQPANPSSTVATTQPVTLPAIVSSSLPVTLPAVLPAASPAAPQPSLPTPLHPTQSTAALPSVLSVKTPEMLETTTQKKKFSFTEGETGLKNLFAKSDKPSPASLSLFQRNEQTTNSNFSYQKPVATTTVTVPTVPTANAVFTFDANTKPITSALQSEPKLGFNFGTNKNNSNSFTFKFGSTADNAGSKRFSLPSGTSVSASNPLSGNVLAAGNGLPTGNGLLDGNLATEQSHNPLRAHSDLGSTNVFGATVQKDNIWSPPSFNTNAQNLFGTNNTANNLSKPVFAFGSTSTPFNNSTPVFGSSAPPTQNMFGMPNQNTPNPQQSLFSSPAPNQPASNIFGSPQSASGPEASLGIFGTPNVSSGTTFGGPTPATPSFEAAPIAQPPGAAFNFGAPQSMAVFGFGQAQQAQQPQQPQQPYNFGSPAAGSPQVQFNMGNMGSAGARRVRKAVRRNPR